MSKKEVVIMAWNFHRKETTLRFLLGRMQVVRTSKKSISRRVNYSRRWRMTKILGRSTVNTETLIVDKCWKSRVAGKGLMNGKKEI